MSVTGSSSGDDFFDMHPGHQAAPEPAEKFRAYVIEDLMIAGRVAAAGYVGGVGACGPARPQRNLTGDPYTTDGRRAVILLRGREQNLTSAGDRGS